MYQPKDRITVVRNTQCHGEVLEATEKQVTVKLDNFSTPTNLSVDEIKPEEK
jgi:hypothetical protein